MLIKILRPLLFFGLVSCATLHDKARDHLEAEAYDQAMQVYMQILESDPRDDKALAGLKSAQTGWLDKNLVKVRLLRLAGNRRQSLNLLLEVYSNETRWDVFPEGAVAFTQKEETRFGQRSVLLLVSRSIEANKPLQAQFDLNRYQVFFQDRTAKTNHLQASQAVKKMATQHCRNFSKDLKEQQFFYGRFVKNFCRVWGLRGPSLKRQAKKARRALYNSIEFHPLTDEFPPGFATKLKNSLFGEFKKTPWYEPMGKRALGLNFEGQYRYSHNTYTKYLKHSYTVSVPYQVKRIENKDQQKDKNSSSLESVGSVISGIATLAAVSAGRPTSTTDHKVDNGDGTVTVYETRYRDEPRETSYRATEHIENFDLSLILTALFPQDAFDVVFTDNHQNSSIEHNNNMPNIGLYPKKASLVGRKQWLKPRMQKLVSLFGKHLQQAWQQRYCQEPLGNLAKGYEVEYLFRCLKAKPDETPTHLSRWFEHNYGLTVVDTHKIVGDLMPNKKL